MPRVTVSEVRSIIDVDSSITDADVAVFINAANLIVTQNVTGLNDDLTKEIERWLSAHLLAVRDRRPIHKEIGDTVERYGEKLWKGLESTIYGQQVVLLDSTGTLIGTGKGKAEVRTIA